MLQKTWLSQVEQRQKMIVALTSNRVKKIMESRHQETAPPEELFNPDKDSTSDLEEIAAEEGLDIMAG